MSVTRLEARGTKRKGGKPASPHVRRDEGKATTASYETQGRGKNTFRSATYQVIYLPANEQAHGGV